MSPLDFVLRDVYVKGVYAGRMVMQCPPESNFRDFTEFERQHRQIDATAMSSVVLNATAVEIHLQLRGSPDLSECMEHERFDVTVRLSGFDDIHSKHVYRLQSVKRAHVSTREAPEPPEPDRDELRDLVRELQEAMTLQIQILNRRNSLDMNYADELTEVVEFLKKKNSRYI